MNKNWHVITTNILWIKASHILRINNLLHTFRRYLFTENDQLCCEKTLNAGQHYGHAFLPSRRISVQLQTTPLSNRFMK